MKVVERASGISVKHVIAAIDPDPAKAPALTKWAREYWEAVHPFDSAGGYLNFMIDDEGESRVKASYRENYPRLAAIKKKYDPTNFFRVNQNITPAGREAEHGSVKNSVIWHFVLPRAVRS